MGRGERPIRTALTKPPWPIATLSLSLIGAGVLLWAMAIVRAGAAVGLFSHQATTPLSGATFAIMGGLVLSRHPRHPIGWMLAGLGLITGIEVLNLGVLVFYSLEAPGQVIPAPALAHSLANWIYVPRGVIPGTLFVLLFPDGRVPSRRWRPIAWAAVLMVTLLTITSALSPATWRGLGGIVRNPVAVSGPIVESIALLGSILAVPVVLTCLAAVFVRFRRSDGIARQQLKWMAFAVVALLAMSLMGIGLLVGLTNSRLAAELAFTMVNTATIVIAGAASVAVLRYRLYDIDLIINRTLVYGGLTAIVVGLYVVAVGSLSAVFQTQGNLVIALIATGLIAVLFQPMRERLELAVNRLLYGQRDEPYRVMSQMGRRLEVAEAPDAMYSSIVETVADSLKLPYAAIALSGGDSIAAKTGQATAPAVGIPLIYQGERVGELLCSPRSPGEPFTTAEENLLQDIANQAAVAVHALMLSADLQRSREQLVSAREEERQRLRRDLHDGLGPQLASLALKLDAARNQLGQDPKLADAILMQLRWDVQDAIADIRRLVYNLRPPVLDELGLLSALRVGAASQSSATGPLIVVEGPESLPALPAAVEVAAYRIAQEAMNNAARHAHAQHCTVRLLLNDGLELEVLDDGDGLPQTFQRGVGLNSMQERTAELGGQFAIEPRQEGGARVLARFPLSSVER